MSGSVKIEKKKRSKSENTERPTKRQAATDSGLAVPTATEVPAQWDLSKLCPKPMWNKAIQSAMMEAMWYLTHNGDDFKSNVELRTPPVLLTGSDLAGIGKLKDPQKPYSNENSYEYFLKAVVGQVPDYIVEKIPQVPKDHGDFKSCLMAAYRLISDMVFDDPKLQAAATKDEMETAKQILPNGTPEEQEKLAKDRFFKKMKFPPFRDEEGNIKETFTIRASANALQNNKEKDASKVQPVPLDASPEMAEYLRVAGPFCEKKKRDVWFFDKTGKRKWEKEQVQDPFQEMLQPGMIVSFGFNMRMWSNKGGFGVKLILNTRSIKIHDEPTPDQTATLLSQFSGPAPPVDNYGF
jgi:hypothetical protein